MIKLCTGHIGSASGDQDLTMIITVDIRMSVEFILSVAHNSQMTKCTHVFRELMQALIIDLE